MSNGVLYSVFLSNLLTTLKVALTAHTSSLALFFIALSVSIYRRKESLETCHQLWH